VEICRRPRIKGVDVGQLEHLEHVAVEDQLHFGAITVALGDHLVNQSGKLPVTGEILEGIALLVVTGA